MAYDIRLRSADTIGMHSVFSRRSLKRLEGTPAKRPSNTMATREILKRAGTDEARTILASWNPITFIKTLVSIPIRSADTSDAVVSADEAKGILMRNKLRVSLGLAPLGLTEENKTTLETLIAKNNLVRIGRAIVFNTEAPIDARIDSLNGLIRSHKSGKLQEGDRLELLNKLATLAQKRGTDPIIANAATKALEKLNPKMAQELEINMAQNTPQHKQPTYWRGKDIRELDGEDLDDYIKDLRGY